MGGGLPPAYCGVGRSGGAVKDPPPLFRGKVYKRGAPSSVWYPMAETNPHPTADMDDNEQYDLKVTNKGTLYSVMLNGVAVQTDLSRVEAEELSLRLKDALDTV